MKWDYHWTIRDDGLIIEAATKEEWAARAMNAEANLAKVIET